MATLGSNSLLSSFNRIIIDLAEVCAANCIRVSGTVFRCGIDLRTHQGYIYRMKERYVRDFRFDFFTSLGDLFLGSP